jgi:hypothetical protein
MLSFPYALRVRLNEPGLVKKLLRVCQKSVKKKIAKKGGVLFLPEPVVVLFRDQLGDHEIPSSPVIFQIRADAVNDKSCILQAIDE